MKKEFESLKLLKSEILDSLRKLDDLEQKLIALSPEKISSTTSEEELIVIGYFLSGIYSNLEDIFVKIARVFENKLDDPAQWHVELLNRMALDVEDVRPAVISNKTRMCLDELRRFRHIYRFSYAFELDWEKMSIIVKRWQSCSKGIHQDFTAFIEKIDVHLT